MQAKVNKKLNTLHELITYNKLFINFFCLNFLLKNVIQIFIRFVLTYIKNLSKKKIRYSIKFKPKKQLSVKLFFKYLNVHYKNSHVINQNFVRSYLINFDQMFYYCVGFNSFNINLQKQQEIIFLKNSMFNFNNIINSSSIFLFKNNIMCSNIQSYLNFSILYKNHVNSVCNIYLLKSKRNFFLSASTNYNKTCVFKFSSGIIKNSKYKRSKRGKYSECDHTIRIFSSFLKKKIQNFNYVRNFNIFLKKKANMNLKKLLGTLTYKLSHIKITFNSKIQNQVFINNIVSNTRKKFGLNLLKRPKRKRKRHFRFNKFRNN